MMARWLHIEIQIRNQLSCVSDLNYHIQISLIHRITTLAILLLMAFIAHSFSCSISLRPEAPPTVLGRTLNCAFSLGALHLFVQCLVLARQHPAAYKPFTLLHAPSSAQSPAL